MSTTQAASPQAPVSLAEAARRTGLADSAAAMAPVAAAAEAATTQRRERDYVDLCAFRGAPGDVELGDVVVLESGRL